VAKDYIEQRNGDYYITGTRISLASVVYGFRDGESPETIQDNFRLLTLEEVYGAITFYLANREMVDEHLKRREEKFEQARAAQPPLPEGLRRRLEAAREQLRSRR
jgi:uncharacterized protein (DUF433 family)